MLIRNFSKLFLRSGSSVKHHLGTFQKFSNLEINKIMNKEDEMSLFEVGKDTKFTFLSCRQAFERLTNKQKQYAHYMAKATWYGSLITLYQTSVESPAIFLLMFSTFRSVSSMEEMKKKCCEVLTEEEYQALIFYYSGVLCYMGNYKGFGDTKIVPNIPKEKYLKLYTEIFRDVVLFEENELKEVVDDIFSLEPIKRQLGYDGKGTTTYLTSNITEEDADAAKVFMSERHIEPYNTRLAKDRSSGELKIIIASQGSTKTNIDGFDLFTPIQFKERKFRIVRGDHCILMKRCADFLEKAQKNSANDYQKEMLEKYIESFRTGSLVAHIDGSRNWILDTRPSVESYIGFIETYRDPTGQRGEFEGFVSMVNAERSKVFGDLVKNAEKYISTLPWSKEYEKDRFLKPDFTSLDILAFGGSGVPAGINIPNYDEVRQNEGFKNVSLGNVIGASLKEKDLDRITFIDENEKELFSDYRIPAFDVQVGLHELLGHGTGKLFRKLKNGTFNFDAESTINPLTKEKVTTYYNSGEGYDGMFGEVSSSYEECRAECVGLYLCVNKDILKLFGIAPEKMDHLIFNNWLSMCRAGLCGLEYYTPETQRWRQAHMQARYVILQVLLEAGAVEIVEIKGEEDQSDLRVRMNLPDILSKGFKAISDFLVKLQTYKSIGDKKEGISMYKKYSTVNEKFMEWRKIVIAKRLSRKLIVQANTKIEENDLVSIVDYEESADGMLKSWFDGNRLLELEEKDLMQEMKTLYELNRREFAPID
ncbi:hypothetical protein SNEBB_002531 [Seison nebaliae]|nr:hypothetical protein SNEBB_002531 [Seison nebaliae]